MEHLDVEQLELENTHTGFRWWSFCTCGLAFGGTTSQQAYDRWEQHEADEL
jgi:hypothetical protein